MDLVAGNVAAEGLAVFTALQVVVRPVGALANDTEFARLHVLDPGNLLEDMSGVKLFHAGNIYTCIYYSIKNKHWSHFPEWRLTPVHSCRFRRAFVFVRWITYTKSVFPIIAQAASCAEIYAVPWKGTGKALPRMRYSGIALLFGAVFAGCAFFVVATRAFAFPASILARLAVY